MASLITFSARATTASPQDSGHSIVIKGKGTSYVDITFKNALTIRCCSLEEDGRSFGFTGHTRGSYVGYALKRLSSGRIVVGGVIIPKMRVGWMKAVALVRPGGRIKAGRYRLFLLTDGPSVVRIKADGLDHEMVRRTSRRTASSDWSGPIGEKPPTPAGETRFPIAVTERTHVIMASLVKLGMNKALYQSNCLTEREATKLICDPTDPFDEPWVGEIDGWQQFYVKNYEAGYAEPGEYTAEFIYGTAGEVKKAKYFLLTFEI